MTVWYKEGVYGDLEPEAAEGLRQTDRLYSRLKKDVFVTSKRDGAHGPGSFHPHGLAWDQRINGVALSVHRKRLGKKFQIVDHGRPKHRHVEYDPPRPRS